MRRPPPSPAERVSPGPGQESVWDYPRPAICERVARPIRIVFAGETIVESAEAFRVLETSHPPTYYAPPTSVKAGALAPSGRRTLCEWKGQARYFDVIAGDRRAADAAWAYDAPTPAFRDMTGWIAFYPAAMDACFVGGERVSAQPGGFYGGWVTSDVVGPFKGETGTEWW